MLEGPYMESVHLRKKKKLNTKIRKEKWLAALILMSVEGPHKDREACVCVADGSSIYSGRVL